MFTNVYTKTLRDMRRGLIGWSVGIVALVAMIVALWPTVREMNLDALVEAYPEALREMFNIDQIASGPGFLNAELFSSILPTMFIVYGIGAGARLLAREEGAETLDVLLSTPISRQRLMIDKALAAATGLVGLGVVLFASTWVLAGVVNMGVTVGYAAGASLAVTLLGLLYGAIAYAVTAVTGKRGLAIAVATSLAVVGFVFYGVAGFVESLSSWDWITPFHHVLGTGPASTGSGGIPLGFLWLAIAVPALIAATLPVFRRRDIGL